jgi:hypothetical protein
VCGIRSIRLRTQFPLVLHAAILYSKTIITIQRCRRTIVLGRWYRCYLTRPLGVFGGLHPWRMQNIYQVLETWSASNYGIYLWKPEMWLKGNGELKENMRGYARASFYLFLIHRFTFPVMFHLNVHSHVFTHTFFFWFVTTKAKYYIVRKHRNIKRFRRTRPLKRKSFSSAQLQHEISRMDTLSKVESLSKWFLCRSFWALVPAPPTRLVLDPVPISEKLLW